MTCSRRSRLHSQIHAKSVYLVGWEESGIWAILAKALAGDAVDRTVADAAQFRFENIKKTDDEMMLPGAVKYGGMPAFCACAHRVNFSCTTIKGRRRDR